MATNDVAERQSTNLLTNLAGWWDEVAKKACLLGPILGYLLDAKEVFLMGSWVNAASENTLTPRCGQSLIETTFQGRCHLVWFVNLGRHYPQPTSML